MNRGQPEMRIPVPDCVNEIVARHTHNANPGLLLDKYVKSYDVKKQAAKLSGPVQGPAIDEIVRCSNRFADAHSIADLTARRTQTLLLLGGMAWERETSTPLTLHLARASALENAGICLHPIHGFPYLPGSGLKGLAHAYACEIWLPAQSDCKAAWAQICHVFGFCPAPWLDALANRLDVKVPEGSAIGRIVFHDAWPTKRPQLQTDILNPHHAQYYRGRDDPGDWDSPIPVYFLSLPAGQKFSFAIAKHRQDTSDELLHLAQSWLDGGLTHLGCGAKTNSGYGYFKPTATDTAAAHSLTTSGRAVLDTVVELTTPAFLAGAHQDTDEDCTLRPATLRGQLRWWWRTMHVGYMSTDQLRELEATLWGDSHRGGAIQLLAEPAGTTTSQIFDVKDGFRPKHDFEKENGLMGPPDKKTTQGLFYLSYGMNERSQGKQRIRHFVDRGAKWRVRLMARPAKHGGEKNTRVLSAAQVMKQATAALWLLCTYGAVGSKARKGFGSLQLGDKQLANWSVEACRDAGRELQNGAPFNRDNLHSSSLHPELLIERTVPTPFTNPWQALDTVGYAYQAFAKALKRKHIKRALGLPRNINGPDRSQMDWLSVDRTGHKNAQNVRFASPIHLHFSRGTDGKFTVRVIAFVQRHLPDENESRKVLSQFVNEFAAEMAALWGVATRIAPGSATSIAPSLVQTPPGLPKANDRVQAEMMADPKEKGRPWARLISHPDLHGPIQNHEDVPADATVGREVTLKVASIGATGKQPQFRWPTPADDEKDAKRAKQGGQRGHRGGPGRGRR